MLEKEVEWWSLPSALTIYCYCLHRLIVSSKFVSTKRDNYLLTLNCTEALVQCNLRQITCKIFWLTFKKCFVMLYELVKKGWVVFSMISLPERQFWQWASSRIFLWFLDRKVALILTSRKKLQC